MLRTRPEKQQKLKTATETFSALRVSLAIELSKQQQSILAQVQQFSLQQIYENRPSVCMLSEQPTQLLLGQKLSNHYVFIDETNAKLLTFHSSEYSSE